jgi:hypothetical protein
VLDDSVRKAWQIDGSKVQLSEEWKAAPVAKAVALTSEEFGVEDWNVEARLYKLVLYEGRWIFQGTQGYSKGEGHVCNAVCAVAY